MSRLVFMSLVEAFFVMKQAFFGFFLQYGICLEIYYKLVPAKKEPFFCKLVPRQFWQEPICN